MSPTTSPDTALGAAYTSLPSGQARPLKVFERRLATEQQDYHDIVTGILHAQKRLASQQHRPLGRGTHTKGICVRGVLEVTDLSATVSDPVLRERLAHGIFAKPGRYPVTIRFANAASTINPDYKRDVRAISFAVSVPAGVLGPLAVRLDYSANSTRVFAINDAHAFACLMRVIEAGGTLDKLKAASLLSLRETGSLLATGFRGAVQTAQRVMPFQRLRYWSNVAFRHGPNEAVKYALTARPSNPTGAPAPDDDMLRDDLIRVLDSDRAPIEFDFAVQLLEADRMHRRGRKRDEIFWVENASVDWPEKEAPFYNVARLSVHHDGVLSEEESRDFYIDVNEHSTVESRPLGSINRARWYGEAASRRARLGLAGAETVDPLAPSDPVTGAPLAPIPPERTRSISDVPIRGLLKPLVFGGVLATVAIMAFNLGNLLVIRSGRGMIPDVQLENVAYDDNGWGSGVDAIARQTYYYTPQGAGLKDVRYSWFLNLEMPWGKQRVADPAVMRRFGFLVDPPTPRNPSQLPVGFTRHYDRVMHEELLDITCATCHTGQLERTTKDGRTHALRVDGGQAGHDFTNASMGSFVPTVLVSMIATELNPFKFNRFARNVLGKGYPDGKWALRKNMFAVIRTLTHIAITERNLTPTPEGFGRTDALARIGNTVFGENLDEKNLAVGNAPVSFPGVWNIWKFDWVQYNASVSQPMARNLGEAMGVGAKYALVDQYGAPLPPEERFRSSADIARLDTIENTLWELHPPKWNEAVLGPINHARADSGRVLFEKNCVSCHGPHIAPAGIKAMNSPGKSSTQPEWLVASFCADDIGTDPTAAANFAKRRLDITRTGLSAMDLRNIAMVNRKPYDERKAKYLKDEIARLAAFPDSAARRNVLKGELDSIPIKAAADLSALDPRSLSLGAALSFLGVKVRERAYADMQLDSTQRATLDGFGRLDVPQTVDGYKSRPLSGVWATPPFLHNGSVPTVFALLSPYEERPKTFQVGSREYDPVLLGLATVKANGDSVRGYKTFNTDDVGNHNTGHEFGAGYDVKPRKAGFIGSALSKEDRLRIIEYLKIRDDDVEAPSKPNIPHTCAPVR